MEIMATGGDSCSSAALLNRGLKLQEEVLSWGGPGSARLLKLVRGELAFVNRLAGLPNLPRSCPELRSSNFDHLEAVFSILQNPIVSGVSAVMQSFAVTDSAADERDLDETRVPIVAHVDIVCMLHGKPIWLVISTRNPRYVMWSDSSKEVKVLRSRLLLLLRAACVDAVTRPASILLCFNGEVDDEVDRGLKDEFGAVRGFALGDDRAAQVHQQHVGSSSALESSIVVLHPKDIHDQQDEEDCNFSEVEGGEWLDVEVNHDAGAAAADEISAFPTWVTYDVAVASIRGTELSRSCSEATADVQGREKKEEETLATSVHDSTVLLPVVDQNVQESESDDACCRLSKSIHDEVDTDDLRQGQITAVDHGLINLDTTALIALVSEVSNGGAEHLLSLADEVMMKRFSNMTAFIREQALSELNKPLVKEIEGAISSRQMVVTQYVHDEFCSIVSLVGGIKERGRAEKLLHRVRVVPNTPSERILALPLTGKIKSRHKLVFGTGDQLTVPTLTANTAFVRAARQKGMAIEVVEHRPRALTGD